MGFSNILLVVANFMLVIVTAFLFRATKKYADATVDMHRTANEQKEIVLSQTEATKNYVRATERLLQLERIKFLLQSWQYLEQPMKVVTEIRQIILAEGNERGIKTRMAQEYKKLWTIVFDDIWGDVERMERNIP